MARIAETTRPRLTRDDVLDARQVADLLHLPTSTALDLARRGILPGHKLGRRWIFLHDEIETHVRNTPGRNISAPTQQRPARQAGGDVPRYKKRYPQVVPARAVTQQPALFR
jgi:hypothetical protein